MSDKTEIAPEKLAELSALAKAAGAPLSPDQCRAEFIRVKDRQYDDFHAAASPPVVAALVAEVKRLREDEAQLVALVARAHVKDADDAPLPAPSPDPCRPTKLQAAIETVRKRFSWVVCDGDAGNALLAVLAAAERVPALEARVAEALAALHSLASNRADQDMAGESDSIKQMHVGYLESGAFADAQLRARDAERHHIIRGRCSVYLNLCSNDEWGNKVDAIADEFIAEARARPEADHE